ncbi:MAG: GTP cyclohydrolase II [Spirochaetales bacterium]|nr:GTP cyclohydrolase II [Spirochaetales bacterium]
MNRMLTVPQALALMAEGKPLIVTDDEGRENEGDFIFAADHCGPEQVNLMISRGKGLVCQAITQEQANRLHLTPQAPGEHDAMKTAFTISVDAAEGVTTGISAQDRAKAVQILANRNSQSHQLRRPGHLFPLVARPGGVRQRPGHTEAAVDLAALAGCSPSGVICEILGEDGRAANRDGLEQLAQELHTGILTIEELTRWLHLHHPGKSTFSNTSKGDTSPVESVHPQAALPTRFGNFALRSYPEIQGGEWPHLAMIAHREPKDGIPTVRIHSECLTGEVMGSLRCDCRDQLQAALERIDGLGGALVYLRQEGRGIGLTEKIRAYALQDDGMDTFEANRALGHADDERDYTPAITILNDLGYEKIRLITNNPDKVAALQEAGIHVVEQVPLATPIGVHNHAYLAAKQDQAGHCIPGIEEPAQEQTSLRA